MVRGGQTRCFGLTSSVSLCTVGRYVLTISFSLELTELKSKPLSCVSPFSKRLSVASSPPGWVFMVCLVFFFYQIQPRVIKWDISSQDLFDLLFAFSSVRKKTNKKNGSLQLFHLVVSLWRKKKDIIAVCLFVFLNKRVTRITAL